MFTPTLPERVSETSRLNISKQSTALKPFPTYVSTQKTYGREEFRLKSQFGVTFHVFKNLTCGSHVSRMGISCSEPNENEHYYYVHTVETLCYNNIETKVVTKGVFGPDMDHLMSLGGTLKMKKLVNILIKVCEDEILY